MIFFAFIFHFAVSMHEIHIILYYLEVFFYRNRVNTANVLTVLKTVSNQMSGFFKFQEKKLGNRARANDLHILITKRSL